MSEVKKVPEIRFAGFAEPWEQRKLGELSSSFEYGLRKTSLHQIQIYLLPRITDCLKEIYYLPEQGQASGKAISTRRLMD